MILLNLLFKKGETIMDSWGEVADVFRYDNSGLNISGLQKEVKEFLDHTDGQFTAKEITEKMAHAPSNVKFVLERLRQTYEVEVILEFDEYGMTERFKAKKKPCQQQG